MISRWDRAVVEAFQHLHWGPADWFAELLSEWWVKSLVIIGIGLIADIWTRRFPLGVGLATISYLAAEGLSLQMKSWFDRERPSVADPAVHPLVAVPHNGSMPSTHAASAFAAALAVGFVHPKLRWWLLVARHADLALSRLARRPLPLGRDRRCGRRLRGRLGGVVPQPSRRSSVSSTFANRRLSQPAPAQHEQQPVGGRGPFDLGRERDERAVALGQDLPGDRADGRPEHGAADETATGLRPRPPRSEPRA